MRQEKAAHEHLLAKDKKYQARVTAILESNWKSANTVAGHNLEELDSNAGDGLSTVDLKEKIFYLSKCDTIAATSDL